MSKSLIDRHPHFYHPDGKRKEVTQHGHAYEIVPTAEEFYKRLTGDIASAQPGQTVALEFYTFEKDKKTAPIFQALADAATRGVRVQLIADHWSSNPFNLINSYISFQGLNRQGRRHGHPIEVKLAKQDGETKSLAKRDHKKLAVITGTTPEQTVAYFGGINMAGRNTRMEHFMVRTTGEVAQFVMDDFQKTWEGKNIEHYKRTATDGSTLFFDTKESETVLAEITQQMQQAKKRIWLQSAYFDFGSVRDALVKAKLANPRLDVRLIVPHQQTTNHPLYMFFTNKMLEPLVKAGVSIFKDGGGLDTYLRFFNHAKALLIDDIAYTGSFNFTNDPLSGGNAEVVFKTAESNFVHSMGRWFADQFLHARQYKARRGRVMGAGIS